MITRSLWLVHQAYLTARTLQLSKLLVCNRQPGEVILDPVYPERHFAILKPLVLGLLLIPFFIYFQAPAIAEITIAPATSVTEAGVTESLEEAFGLPHAKADNMSPDQIWTMLGTGAWIGNGNPNAPKVVYIFSDPACPYCHQLWREVRPWVEAGKVQLRYFMVGILGSNSTAKAAAILASEDPQASLSRYEQMIHNESLEAPIEIPSTARSQVQDNEALMHNMGFNIVPGIVVRNQQGQIERWPGLPAPDELASMLGSLNSN